MTGMEKNHWSEACAQREQQAEGGTLDSPTVGVRRRRTGKRVRGEPSGDGRKAQRAWTGRALRIGWML